MRFSDRHFCHRLLKKPFSRRRLRTKSTHLEHNPSFLRPRSHDLPHAADDVTPPADSLGQTNNGGSHLHTRMDRIAKAAKDRLDGRFRQVCNASKVVDGHVDGDWLWKRVEKQISPSDQFSLHYFQKPSGHPTPATKSSSVISFSGCGNVQLACMGQHWTITCPKVKG